MISKEMKSYDGYSRKINYRKIPDFRENYRLHPPAVSAKLTTERSVHIRKVILRANRGDSHLKCRMFGLWHDLDSEKKQN